MKLALALVYFVFAILLNSVGPVIMQVIESFKVSHSAASILEAFKDLSIAIASFLIAPFLPRLGYKNSLLGSLFFAGGACCMMPLMPGFLATKLFFLCVGFAFAFAKVSIYSSVALVTDGSRQHAAFMNTVEGLYMVGVLAGYGIFGYFFGASEPGTTEWIRVYWLLASMCLLVFVMVLFTPFREGEQGPTGSLASDFSKMVQLMAMPLVYIFVICAFLYVLIEQGLGTWLPTFNKEVLGVPNAMSVQVTGIFAATLAIGRLSAGALIHRFGWYALLNASLFCMAALVLGTLPFTYGYEANPEMTWGTAPIAAYVFPFVGLFMAPIYPALSSVMLSSLPKRQHSSMTGLIVIFSALGGSAGSMITGYVFGHFSGQTAFYFSLVPIVVITITLRLFRRETNKAIEAKEAARKLEADPQEP